MKMSDIFTEEAYKCLTPEERRAELKRQQVAEYSGLRKYPTTCARTLERIPHEMWEAYSARQLGEIAKLLKIAYDDGVYDAKNGNRPAPKNALEARRRQLGLTQHELADKIGCYPKDISRWESGVHTPTTNMLVKIAAALNCTVDDLIEGKQTE